MKMRRDRLGCLLVVLLMAGGVFLPHQPALADECLSTAEITPDGQLFLHIPALQVGAYTFSLDLQYTPTEDGLAWFGVAGIGALAGLPCENPALFDLVSGAYELYLPTLPLGNDHYWLTLEYVADTAAAHMRTAAGNKGPFKLKKAGNKGTTIPGMDRTPDTLKFALNMSQTLGTLPDQWEARIFMTATVPLQEFVTGPSSILYGAVPSAAADVHVTEASCSMSDSHLECQCAIDLNSPPSFEVTDLKITGINTFYPLVSLSYKLELPSSAMTMRWKCRHLTGGDWSSEVTADYGMYYPLKENYKALNDVWKGGYTYGVFEALSWSFHPDPRGHLYATKNYPTQTAPIYQGEVRGSAAMSLIESNKQ